MRHMNRGRRLSRTSSHRKAMFRNMVAGLFKNGRIITTPAKAKEARPFAERLITLAKRGPEDLAARRRAIRLLHDPALVRSLFEDLGVRYKDRQGGYTRILHLSKTRVGDGARQVLFELVEGGAPMGKDKAERPKAAVVDNSDVTPATGTDADNKPIADSLANEMPTSDTPAEDGNQRSDPDKIIPGPEAATANDEAAEDQVEKNKSEQEDC